MNKDLFEAAGRIYTWQRVLSAADFRGDTAGARGDLATSLAMRAYADEQGFEPPQSDVENAVDDFRVQHNLIAGEDMDRWLEHCGLALDEVEGVFAGLLLAARFDDQLDEIRRDYAPSPADVDEAMWLHALLTGQYETMTAGLARRVAARLDGRSVPAPADVKAAKREGRKRLKGRDVDAAWFDDLVQMEAIYEAAERDLLSPEKCEREVRAASLHLTRIEIAGLAFTSLDQAREAYQCVAHEGESLDAVADRVGGEVQAETAFYDDVPADTRTLLFSATAGKAFPPEDRDGIFLLRQVRQRIEPGLGDPDVAARVRERLVGAHFDALMSQHVRWLFEPWNQV